MLCNHNGFHVEGAYFKGLIFWSMWQSGVSQFPATFAKTDTTLDVGKFSFGTNLIPKKLTKLHRKL